MNDDTGRDVLLRARGLDLGYGRRTVLEGVDFEIRAGEFWFLLGPNGTGKTTLLNAILGLLRPRSGSLWRHPVRADREHLGFVPQQCELAPSLPTTVREFVSLGLAGTRVARSQGHERCRWALARAGLAALARADYWSLSGGQRQRALVARALLRRPGLLLLDEPTEGLDPASEDALLDTLADLNSRDAMTLLFVTHKLSIAARYASHVALIHSGTLHPAPRETALQPHELERAFGVAIDLQWEADRSGRTPT